MNESHAVLARSRVNFEHKRPELADVTRDGHRQRADRARHGGGLMGELADRVGAMQVRASTPDGAITTELRDRDI